MILDLCLMILAVWLGWQFLKILFGLAWGLFRILSVIAVILMIPAALGLLMVCGVTAMLLPVVIVCGIGCLIGKRIA